uniref:Uncharacterized protein n=1 Tax=Anguilla anguilla TaxID=7936 RepID=A0A0E9TX34_ANGAN
MTYRRFSFQKRANGGVKSFQGGQGWTFPYSSKHP